MMDRYEADIFELDISERTGYHFMTCASTLCDAFSRLSVPRHIKLKEKIQGLRSAVDLAGSLWLEHEPSRPPYTIPVGLKQDYHFAKKRFLFMKAHPENFYETNEQQREELEKERKMLAVKIALKEIELARAEDDRRHHIRDQRKKWIHELEVLTAKRERYEGFIRKKSPSILTACLGSYQERLEAIIESAKRVEAELNNQDKPSCPDLDDKQYQLTLLRKRRFEVAKLLNIRSDHHRVHVTRWQSAVDNAETVMIVRQMDIANAARRYYSIEPINIIHAFLSVYVIIKDMLSQPIMINDDIKQQLTILEKCANELIALSLAGRSVETLYQKMQALNEDERNQVILQKPVKNHLPDALLRTLSSKRFQHDEASSALFRKVLPSIETEESAPKKIMK